MQYLSKGAIAAQSTDRMFCVTLRGVDYMLSGIGTHLWRSGQLQISEARNPQQEKHLRKLEYLGLVALSEEQGALAPYHLLTRCIICPAGYQEPVHALLSMSESIVWKWISAAGLRLTIGELVMLHDRNIEPTRNLLGKKNTQALIKRLYFSDMFLDTTPDIMMEHSLQCDTVVNAVLGLLQKKRIILT